VKGLVLKGKGITLTDSFDEFCIGSVPGINGCLPEMIN
jgi:hypothetical protein